MKTQVKKRSKTVQVDATTITFTLTIQEARDLRRYLNSVGWPQDTIVDRIAEAIWDITDDVTDSYR